MSLSVLIYTKSDCPFCEKAKDWLDENLIDWKAIVFDDFGERQAMYASLGLEGPEKTVPQILVQNLDGETVEHIKGFKALTQSGLEYRASLSF